MRPENMRAFALEIHQDNVTAGWWTDVRTGESLIGKRNIGELLCLMHSEVSEAHEGFLFDLPDDKLPHRKMFEVELADIVIRDMDTIGAWRFDPLRVGPGISPSFDASHPRYQGLLGLHQVIDEAMEAFRKKRLTEAEYALARLVVLVEQLAKQHKCDLWGAIAEKRAFNKVRADHKMENRVAAGGKEF